MRKPNDVGVAWKKTNDIGEYLSIAIDLEVLLTLTGGSTDKVNVNAYPIVSDNPKAPDYQLKYYPKTTGARPAAAPKPASGRMDDEMGAPLTDDDIPF
jgi:uncharacterized protein (DUF736 family)